MDAASPYRYPDADIIEALNLGLMEARRLRPDLFMMNGFTSANLTGTGDTVVLDRMYRPALVYYIVGRMEVRDGEGDKDQRAAAMLNKFTAQLVTTSA